MRSHLLLLAMITPLALGVWAAATGGGSLSFADGIPVSRDADLSSRAPAQEGPATSDAYCLTCHNDQSLTTGFADGRVLSLFVDARALRDSAHGLQPCISCHEANKVCPPERDEPLQYKDYRTQANETCSECHVSAAQEFDGSAHWQPVFADGKGATCYECHSPDASGHTAGRTSDPAVTNATEIEASCGKCHQEAAASYRETSHGKVARFGDARTTATCTTCHNDHDAGAIDDPAEPLTAAKLAPVCAECHTGAGETFAAAWPGHSSDASNGSAAGFMERVGFLWAAAIAGFGLIHVSLDFVRRVRGRSERRM